MTDRLAVRGSSAVTGPEPDRPRDRRRSWLVIAAAITGTVASAYLAMAGTAVGRNVSADDLWFFQVAAVSRSELGGRPALVLLGVALGLVAAAWLLLGQAVRRGAGNRAVLLVGTLWAVPFAVGIPLFSPDAYIYASVGSSIQHGVDPFVEGAGEAGDIRGTRGGEQLWLDNPSPYSPPFVRLLDGLSSLFDEDVRAVVVALRVLTVLAWIGVAVLALRIARLHGLHPTRTLWLTFANPLFLLHAVSGVHNDALMVVLVLAGVWAALLHRPYLGVVLCALGGGIKVMALAAVAVIAVDAAWRATDRAARLRVLAQVGGTGLGFFVVLVTACGWGWSFVRNLSVPGLAIEPLSPPTALAVLIDTGDPPLDLVRTAALAAGALVCAGLLTRVPRWGVLRVLAWVFVTVVVTGSAVWPWYFLWPVVFLALTGVQLERWLAILVPVVGVFLLLPGGRATLPLLGRPLADALVLAALVAVGAGMLWAHRRRRSSREPVATPA